MEQHTKKKQRKFVRKQILVILFTLDYYVQNTEIISKTRTPRRTKTVRETTKGNQSTNHRNRTDGWRAGAEIPVNHASKRYPFCTRRTSAASPLAPDYMQTRGEIEIEFSYCFTIPNLLCHLLRPFDRG